MSPPTSTSGSTSFLGTSSAARPLWRPSTSSTTAPTRVSCGAEGGGRPPGVCPPVTVPTRRGRGPGRHHRRDAAQGSGGHHQQLRADALPAAQGSPAPKTSPFWGVPPLLTGALPPQEPHPARLSAESAARRLAHLDTRSPNVFENLGQLKSFFVEVRTPPGVPGQRWEGWGGQEGAQQLLCPHRASAMGWPWCRPWSPRTKPIPSSLRDPPTSW